MAASSRRRLGKGLSEMFAQPVQVDPPAANAIKPDEATGDASADAAADTPRSPHAADDAAHADASSASESPAPEPRATATAADEAGIAWLVIDNIQPNPYQPRQRVPDASIETLADSIRTHGVMQPIVVRLAPRPPEPPEPSASPGDPKATETTDTTEAGRYEIIAGERRWRAARLAGLKRVPALLRELSNQDAAEWALVENLQREDLNPMDRANAFTRLLEEFSLTHQQVAERVGVDRSSVANLIRLLALDEPVQAMVRDGHLSMGQARAIAGLSDAESQQSLAERAVRRGLSVRQVEKLVRSLSAPDRTPSEQQSNAAKNRPSTSHLNDLEKQIGEQLGTRVSIRPGRKKGSGKLTIEFYSVDAFDDLLERLGVRAE